MARPRSLLVSMPLICLLLLGIPSLPARAAVPPEAIDPAASCASSKCHSDISGYPQLHWSDFAGAGECQKCHEPEGNLHEFSVDDPPALCTGCHEDIGELIRSAATVHDPAEDCTDCHDPHGGRVEALLLGVKDEDDLKPLCFECHDEDLVGEKFAHGPAEQGSCNICHDPHGSPLESLLLAEGPELCGDCHEEIIDEIEASEYVHDPVEEDCTHCHNPHSSPYRKMLLGKKRQLCNECHDDIVDLAENAEVDHAATTTKRECLNCHSPHAANSAPNLKKPQRELCLDCHDEPVESGGRMLLDMQRWLEENEVWHEPIREDGCSGCHQPHGGEHFRLLAQPFPAKFYAPFKLQSFRLCFSCHEDRLVMQRTSRTATGFRDGSRNLHYLHVNRPKKGRTCRACHDLHASPQMLHIREQARFGGWLMPINFEKTETGGSCLPGCHKLKAYDREAPDRRERR